MHGLAGRRRPGAISRDGPAGLDKDMFILRQFSTEMPPSSRRRRRRVPREIDRFSRPRRRTV